MAGLGLTTFAMDKFLNVFRGTTITAPVTFYVGLFTTNPTLRDGSDGVEVSGGGYSRVAITFSAPAASGAGRGINTSVQVTFPTATASWGTAVGFGLWDAATGGNLWRADTLDEALAIATGVTAKIYVGDYPIAFTA